ncbi:MAG: hypothetical protein RLZZ164_587 [Actinomycetota bacterium]|jgi:hypothetical protein
MIDWLTSLQIIAGLAIALILLGLGLAKRKPSRLSIGLFSLVELGLLVQTFASIVLVSGGARAKTDTVEFFAYLFVALVVPVAAGFWAMVERTRWSTYIMAAAALTVVVMVFRMQQIWLG